MCVFVCACVRACVSHHLLALSAVVDRHAEGSAEERSRGEQLHHRAGEVGAVKHRPYLAEQTDHFIKKSLEESGLLSVCNASLNFSLEISESLLEFPTISRWLQRFFADSLQTESRIPTGVLYRAVSAVSNLN